MFGFGKAFGYYLKSLVRLLYTANCALCQSPLTLDEAHLCFQCTRLIKPLSESRCIKCVRPLPPFESGRPICGVCRSIRPYYDHGASLVTYEENVKSLFHQIKFQNKPWLLKTFEPLVESAILNFNLLNYDMMIPIPLDGKRRSQREFNQAELIAKMLRRSNSESAPPIQCWIRKKKKTMAQSQLDRIKRLKNLEDAFSLTHSKMIKNKKILLIDDIFTTGSTINECAKLLKKHGAQTVDFFTLARAQIQ